MNDYEDQLSKLGDEDLRLRLREFSATQAERDERLVEILRGVSASQPKTLRRINAFERWKQYDEANPDEGAIRAHRFEAMIDEASSRGLTGYGPTSREIKARLDLVEAIVEGLYLSGVQENNPKAVAAAHQIWAGWAWIDAAPDYLRDFIGDE